MIGSEYTLHYTRTYSEYTYTLYVIDKVVVLMKIQGRKSVVPSIGLVFLYLVHRCV